MALSSNRQQILAKLANVRHDLQDAVDRSAPGARYDPAVLPQVLRAELAGLVEQLTRLIHKIEDSA